MCRPLALLSNCVPACMLVPVLTACQQLATGSAPLVSQHNQTNPMLVAQARELNRHQSDVTYATRSPFQLDQQLQLWSCSRIGAAVLFSHRYTVKSRWVGTEPHPLQRHMCCVLQQQHTTP